MVKHRADKIFFLIILILTVIGFVIFFSASQSLLSRTTGANFEMVSIKQFAILLVGLIGLIIVSNIHYKKYRQFAFWIFLTSIILNVLVFLPGIGFGTGGAKRWLDLGLFSFQPSEFLKLGFVIYSAYWLTIEKSKIQSFTKGILPFLGILIIPTLILIKEPDTGTFLVLFIAGMVMLFSAGARWKHLFLLFLTAILLIGTLMVFKPYIRDRINTYLNPTQDMMGSSWQINQSLIAIGSGGIDGRGFGQSIQKFNFLPEAIGDSVFAVLSEEFGFIGSSLIVVLFLLFSLFGLRIANKTTDSFGRLLALGIVILISAQAFINISALIGLIPLTGIPLTFISHGGSALVVALLEVGIVLNISRYSQGN